jgi:hypothetical protein
MTVSSDQFSPVSWRWEKARHLRAERVVRRYRGVEARRAELKWWALLTGVALVVSLFTTRGVMAQAAIVFMFIVALGAIGAVVGRQVEFRLRARSFARRCLPAYEITRLEVLADGMRYEWTEAALELKWNSIKQVVETPEFVLCYTGPATAQYVPKSAFNDSDSARRFVALVQSRVNSTNLP